MCFVHITVCPKRGPRGGGNRPPESPNGPYGEPNQGPSRANEEPIRGPGGADKWAQPHACFFLTFCLPPRFFVQLDGTYFSKSKSIPICRHIAQYEQTFLAALSIPHKVIYIYIYIPPQRVWHNDGSLQPHFHFLIYLKRPCMTICFYVYPNCNYTLAEY